MFKNKSIEVNIVSLKKESIDSNENENNLIVKYKEKNYILVLQDIWANLDRYFWVGAKLLIHYFDEEEDKITVDNKSYVVLEPNVLVNPSQIRNTDGCIRKHYISKRIGTTNKKYVMIRGSLVNNAFDLLIEKNDKTQEGIMDEVIKTYFIDLISLEENDLPEYNEIKSTLDRHINSLMVWKTHKKFAESEKVSTEPTFISRKYGLSGRLDLLVNPGKEAVTYELKTGKAPTGKPWQQDKSQVACYQLLLESAYSCVNPESYLIYSQGSGNNLLREGDISGDIRREVIKTRNKIVAIDYALANDLSNQEINKIIPMTESGYCERCMVKKECFEICGKFSEKDCSSCGVISFCESSGNAVKKADLEYYNKYFKMVESERSESRKQFSGIFDDKETVEKEGKAIFNLDFAEEENKTIKLISEKTIESEIRQGDLVLLYSKEITYEEIFKATVTYIDRNNIELKIKKDIDKQLFSSRKWNIYKDTMETTFDTMNGALYNFLREENNDKADLISGRKKPRFLELPKLKLDDSLNEKQKLAICKSLSCEDYFLIQGPPGTGKTHTLANLIIEAVKMGKKVLLSAFTHRAIDNVLSKLLENGFKNFIRIGSHDSVDPEIHPYLIQEKMNEFYFHTIKKAQKSLEDFPVVACSSIYATSSALIKRLKFDYAVVDEAGQLTEPGTISIILQSKRFILIGDHKQLPPVVQNEESKKLGLGKSLFERLIDMNRENIDDVLITLEEQYRMNEKIMSYSNINFYDFCLSAYKEISKQKLSFSKDISESKYKNILDSDNPMIFVDHSSKSSLKVNPDESKIIFDIVSEFIEYGINPEKIGVITPFRAQVAEIRRVFFSGNQEILSKITVDTVDRFQGSDRDLIIFSSVATDEEHITDFFDDFRRINVSVTRAKKKFILVGNKESLFYSELFYKLIRLCDETRINNSFLAI